MSYVICICTYRRPQGLRRLLEHLAKITPAPTAVFVVDNHPDREGLATITTLQEVGYPLIIEAQASVSRGISQARNQVLAAASASGARCAALIDDDEWPGEQWISELLKVQALDDADAVGGPTRPVFETNVSVFFKHSIYYGADLALADNSPCELQACGNVLLKLSALDAIARPWFDPVLGQSGGEDLQFFRRLSALNLKMRWAAKAEVFEAVPAQRSSRKWLQHRITLIANSRVLILKNSQLGPASNVLSCIKTIALGAQSATYSLGGLLDQSLADKAWVLRAKFRGKLQAHLGHKLERGEDH